MSFGNLGLSAIGLVLVMAFLFDSSRHLTLARPGDAKRALRDRQYFILPTTAGFGLSVCLWFLRDPTLSMRLSLVALTAGAWLAMPLMIGIRRAVATRNRWDVGTVLAFVFAWTVASDVLAFVWPLQ